MTANKSITVWHLRDDLEGYEIIHIKVFSIYNTLNLSSLNKGFTNHNNCSIRIPTEKNINIYTGDYIRSGKHYDPFPDKAADMKIIKISDNRRGLTPHWRIICE